jgi:hypothetical protein
MQATGAGQVRPGRPLFCSFPRILSTKKRSRTSKTAPERTSSIDTMTNANLVLGNSLF